MRVQKKRVTYNCSY